MSHFGSYITTSLFFERAAFHSLKTVLVLYLYGWLDYDEDESTILFHLFLTVVGIFPLVGAFIGDSLVGKFYMIIYLFVTYALGCIILTLAVLPSMNLTNDALLLMSASFAGLGLTAIGAGGIKTLILAFTSDQFKSSERSSLLVVYLSTLSYIGFGGSMLSTALAPVIREFQCDREKGCFSVIFALSAILMIAATVSFAIGQQNYRIKRPAGKIFTAIEAYIDANLFRSIVFLYLPLSFFWALFEQQGSRWTLQAIRMDGEIWVYNIKPDQMRLSYYLLVLILIPLINYTVYPLLELFAIKTPLQKIFVGGLLAAVAFIFAAFLEKDLDKLDPVSSNSMTAQLRVYNGLHCSLTLESYPGPGERITVPSLGMYKTNENNEINVSPQARIGLPVPKILGWLRPGKTSDTPYDSSNDEFLCEISTDNKTIKMGKTSSYFFRQGSADSFEAHVAKPRLGLPIIRPLINVPPQVAKISVRDSNHLVTTLASYSTKAITVSRGEATLLANNLPTKSITTRSGGVYVLLGHRNKTDRKIYEFAVYQTVEPNTVHMLRQLPQYICLTVGEMLVSNNVLEYSSSEAPQEMQPILHASWWLMRAIGNLLAVIIMKIKLCDTQSNEYLLFAGLMVIAMLIYMALCLSIAQTNEQPRRSRRSHHGRKSKSRQSVRHTVSEPRKSKSRKSVRHTVSEPRKSKSRQSIRPEKSHESQSDFATTDPETSHHKKPKEIQRSSTIPNSLFSATTNPLPWSISIEKSHSDSEISYRSAGLTTPTKHHRRPTRLTSPASYLSRSSSSSSPTPFCSQTTRSPLPEII